VRFAIAPAALAASLLLAAPARATSQAALSAAELVRQAREHEASHDDLVAIRRYTEALAIDATNADAYLGLGALRLRRGDPREAERVYDSAIAHLPDLGAARVGRAAARRAAGERDLAEQDLEDYASRAGAADAGALKQLAAWYGEDARLPAELATWRRLRALAVATRDDALDHESRTMVRALQIVVGGADPAASPATDDPVRRGLARVARRGGF
jgi:tetratricopeptide (TPR) repeat protein